MNGSEKSAWPKKSKKHPRFDFLDILNDVTPPGLTLLCRCSTSTNHELFKQDWHCDNGVGVRRARRIKRMDVP